LDRQRIDGAFLCNLDILCILRDKTFLRISGVDQMKDWIIHQITDLNVLTIIIMIFFVTTLSKANTNKLLQKQSTEIYNDIEELKDEIWRAADKK
jgi:hypothetical protein